MGGTGGVGATTSNTIVKEKGKGKGDKDAVAAPVGDQLKSLKADKIEVAVAPTSSSVEKRQSTDSVEGTGVGIGVLGVGRKRKSEGGEGGESGEIDPQVLLTRRLKKIWRTINKHELAEPFVSPVDVDKIPGYREVGKGRGIGRGVQLG